MFSELAVHLTTSKYLGKIMHSHEKSYSLLTDQYFILQYNTLSCEKKKHTEFRQQASNIEKYAITWNCLATECLQTYTKHGANFQKSSALPPHERELHRKSVVHHVQSASLSGHQCSHQGF